MQPVSHLSVIADRYDAFILDLWGVVHDGSHLYPGVDVALEKLRGAGKKIIMLSNAPRRAAKVEQVLNGLGVHKEWYDLVYSSGEAGYQWLAAGKAPFGKRYYYIGPPKDADVLNGLDCKRVDDLKEADFLLNVGFGSEEQTNDDWMPLLRAAKAAKIPMLCLNPDLEVVKQTGEHFPCAGVIAHAYAKLGGQVIWFGKPFADVYAHCMQAVAPIPKSRVLAIGDSLETDIPGALGFGIDCALVTGGILKKYSDEKIAAMRAELKLSPTYIMPALNW